MIEDEVGHITWVKDRLDRYAAEKGEALVTDTMRRFTEVDQRVYEAAMRYRDNARELLDPALSGNGNGQARSQPKRRRRRHRGGCDERRSSSARGEVPRRIRTTPILETSSLRDLGVNSLDLVVLVMSIEEHFHIEFDPSDLERLRTFADLRGAVAELKGVR